MSKPSYGWEDEPTQLTDVREVDYDPLDYSSYTVNHIKRRIMRQRQGIFTMLVLFACIILGFGSTLLVQSAVDEEKPEYVVVENEAEQSYGTLSPIFTDEVQYWSDDITRWAEQYQLDPNLIATVMQIESCGNPQAGSPAGAQGLFQVMPFHFQEGEDMQAPDTNALRGLNYLSQGLVLAEGNVGGALAGYNGGHGMISVGYSGWWDEVKRYHYWGTGIYADAVSGETSSDRLTEWLNAGGQRLCDDAAFTQQNLTMNEQNG